MQNAKPLAGIRVLEMAAYISGPYAGALLAGLGAEVVKIEPPRGEAFRRGVGIRDPYFVQYNAGKKSLAVNLKDPAGVALVKSLLPKFDVIIENNRPGKMAALGLGAEDCRAINPRLVYQSISGFGDGGPWRDRAAYDSIGQSMGGFYSLLNDEGDARLSGTCIADLISAIMGAMGVLAALVGRGQTGTGGAVQTSILEAMSAISVDAMTCYYETGVAPTRQARHPQAQNFCLTTASGDALTMHLSSSQKFWEGLARAMDRADLIADARFLTYDDRRRNYFELAPIVQAEFARRTREEWEARLVAHDVPFAPVLTLADMNDHPQYQWLSLVEPDRGGLGVVRPPWRFEGERPGRAERAPHSGEHSRSIASEVCSAEELERLIAAGVVVQTDDDTVRNTDITVRKMASATA